MELSTYIPDATRWPAEIPEIVIASGAKIDQVECLELYGGCLPEVGHRSQRATYQYPGGRLTSVSSCAKPLTSSVGQAKRRKLASFARSKSSHSCPTQVHGSKLPSTELHLRHILTITGLIRPILRCRRRCPPYRKWRYQKSRENVKTRQSLSAHRRHASR